MHSGELSRARPAAPVIDKCALVPILGCAFALIVYPILNFVSLSDVRTLQTQLEARPEPRIFWPVMFAIAVILAAQNRARLARLTWPPHIIWLTAYLAFAGASVLWAFSTERSLIRFVQQVMIVTSIVLPAMVAPRTSDLMRGLFLCFAFALILNGLFVLSGSQAMMTHVSSHGAILEDMGYRGYFEWKNYLGECAAVALLLSLSEARYSGWRRVSGIVFVVIAILLTYLSDSKTALGLALICPLLAALTLMIRKATRISPALILLVIPIGYIFLSSISNFNVYRLSYMFYGDSSLTGRTIIWEFAKQEISQSPVVGWGYQSFWLVPNSPALESHSWVGSMPDAHNGYYDTLLELGQVGRALLLAFIFATVHAIGRMADRDPRRAQLVLSLVLYVIFYNFFESLWMRGFEFLWVVFLIAAAEIGRYWTRLPVKVAASGAKRRRPRMPGPSPRPAPSSAHRLS